MRFKIAYVKRVGPQGPPYVAKRTTKVVEAEDANAARQSVLYDDDTISVESVNKLTARERRDAGE